MDKKNAFLNLLSFPIHFETSQKKLEDIKPDYMRVLLKKIIPSVFNSHRRKPFLTLMVNTGRNLYHIWSFKGMCLNENSSWERSKRNTIRYTVSVQNFTIRIDIQYQRQHSAYFWSICNTTVSFSSFRDFCNIKSFSCLIFIRLSIMISVHILL